LLLLVLVGGEILERPPEWAGIEGNDGIPRFGELAGERSATGAGAHDREVHLVRIAIAAHRHPPAFAEHIGRAPVDGARLVGHGSALPSHGSRSSKPSRT